MKSEGSLTQELDAEIETLQKDLVKTEEVYNGHRERREVALRVFNRQDEEVLALSTDLTMLRARLKALRDIRQKMGRR